MSRASRNRKLTMDMGTPAKTDPILAEKQFWAWAEYHCAKLKRRFKYLDAIRDKEGPNAGIWRIVNRRDSSDHAGEKAFMDFTVEACKRIGYRASGPHDAMQYWLDHINGEHMIKAKLPEINMNEVDFLTVHNDQDETTELHIGRYKQGGEWRDLTGEKINQPALAEVPSVITPGTPIIKVEPKPEPLIKIVGN